MLTVVIFLKKKRAAFFSLAHTHTCVQIHLLAQNCHLASPMITAKYNLFPWQTILRWFTLLLYENTSKWLKLVWKSVWSHYITSFLPHIVLFKGLRCASVCIFSASFHLKCSKTKTSVTGGVSLEKCFLMWGCLKLHLCEILILREYTPFL